MPERVSTRSEPERSPAPREPTAIVVDDRDGLHYGLDATLLVGEASAADGGASHEPIGGVADFAALAPDWFWETGPDLRLRFSLGRIPDPASGPPDGVGVIGRTVWEIVGVDPRQDDAWSAHHEDLMAHRPFRDFRFSMQCGARGLSQLRASGDPLFGADGRFVGYRGVTVDETDDVRSRDRAAEAEAKLREALDRITDGLVIVDTTDPVVWHGREDYALAVAGADDILWNWDLRNDRVVRSCSVAAILGDDPAAADPASWAVRIHPDDVEAYRSRLRRHLKGGSARFECTYRIRDFHGRYRWMTDRATGLRDVTGKVYRMAGSTRDVTADKAAEARANFIAFRDPVTTMPSEAVLRDRIGQEIAAERRTGLAPAVIVLEVANLQDQTAAIDRTAGADVLAEMARRLRGVLRPMDTLARCGPDLFAILLAGIADAKDVADVADRLADALKTAFTMGASEVVLGASMGIATFPFDGRDADTLFRNAATALANVGPSDPRPYRFYTEAMNAAAAARTAVRDDLVRAIDRWEFDVRYEPQVALREPRILGVRTHVTWRHPSQGVIAQAGLAQIAAAAGSIDRLVRRTLREAGGQLRTWRRSGAAPFPICIGMTRVELRIRDLSEIVLSALTEVGLDAADLVIELDEGAISQAPDAIEALMKELSRLGVGFSITGFGVERAGLSQLVRLPIDTVKIDRSFTSKMTGDARFASVVQAIVWMAKLLGRRTLAEGVESVEEVAYLRAYGCDAMQGGLVALPLSAGEFETFLKSFDRRKAA